MLHINNTIVIRVQERVPEETLLVFHTLHVPRRTSDPGMWEADAHLAQHVAQLNAAGRHVAQSLAYHVVDVEAMAAQMSQESVLVDNTHPGPDFMMQVSRRRQPRQRQALLHAAINPQLGSWAGARRANTLNRISKADTTYRLDP